MKPALTALSVLVIAALLASCGDEGGESHPRDRGSDSSDPVLAAWGEGLEGLGLNNGQKWKMDDHTRSSFSKMAASFLDADPLSLEGEGLKKAGSDLQDQVNGLIQGCTMTGEAHGQLHVYLAGYIPAVAALAGSGRSEDAQKVKYYLEKYTEYFE